MGRLQYKIDFEDGGSEENVDVEYLKGLRDAGRPGFISLHDVTWRIQNDPVSQIFQELEEAEQRLGELSGMYSVEPIKTLVSPQPLGLN